MSRLRRRPAHDSLAPLIRTIRTLLLFESMMYSALTPVLPHYAHVLHAGKPALGILVAGYPAGLIPGALLGGWLAARQGVRRTTIAGLVGFGIAIAGFGLSSQIVALDLLRVAQGAFCGLIWGGGLTWLIAAAPVARRGAAIGGAIGAATFGTLLGP
ncbi:MAG: MFS transporter, partial [Solirubrobacteraceae bacterium]